LDLGFIKAGHKLHAFSQEKFTHLRSVRGGRQALARFVQQYPSTESVESPAEWTNDPRHASKTLERWLKVPGNPFYTPDEIEVETPNGGHDHRNSPNGAHAPNEDGAREQEEATLIGPSSLRNRRKHSQDIEELKESLKQVLAQVTALKTQNDKIRKQNEEIKAQNAVIQTQNEQIKAQCEEIKEQYENLQAKLATAAPGASTPSWAGIAAHGNRADQGQNTPRIISSPQQNQSRTPGIDLDLSGMTNPPFDLSSAKEIRERTRLAFDSHPMTKGIKWLGIERKVGEQSKIRICVRTQEEADTARIHGDWLHSHFTGARMMGDQWYPIKVDRVNKSSICDDSNVQFNDDACAKIGLENGISVKKIRFLGRPSPDKAYCSIVIHLSDKREAERMLDQKCMEFDGEVAYTKVFEHIPIPMRCFNCHKFGNHEARRCPAREPVCCTCARIGHTDSECNATTPFCTNCGGPHKASDRGCPEYKKRLDMLQRANHE